MERWRFAADVARLAGSAPRDWSVRIGVFGKWGTGKTTVLKYVEKQVEADGHIAVWLNPWHAATPAELWSKFVLSLHDAARKAGLSIDGAAADKARKHLGFLARMGAAAVSVFSEQAGRLADEAMEFFGVRELLTLGQEQATKLVAQIPDRRFVIFVDDLDRARPDMVPQVLFSLKEILDVGGLSFVLGFDPEIVEEFLSDHYSTRILGKGFLDKIIDFPRTLPPPTEAQLNALATQQRAQRCSFVDAQALERTLPLLGRNPRKIKRFVQNLWLLEPEVGRHREGEINWDMLLLCQVLHGKSRALADVLFAGRGESAFSAYRSAKVWARAGNEQRDESAEKNLEAMIVSAGVAAPDVPDVLAVLETLTERSGVFASSEKLAYHADLLDRPHAVTWKEYDGFREAWGSSEAPAAIEAWVREHASTRREQHRRVFQELWSATARRYTQQLESAADARLDTEQRAATAEASTTLKLMRQLALDAGGLVGAPPFLDLDQVKVLFKAFAQWAHFRSPDSYLPVRDAEKALLLEVAQSLSHAAGPLLELLDPWRDHEGSSHSRALRDEVIEILVPEIFRALFSRFREPNGIATLPAVRSGSAENFVFFRKDDRWWTEDRMATLGEIVDGARDSGVVHENVVEFLHRIGRAVDAGMIRDPATNKVWKEAVTVCWSGLVAQPLQYRAIGTYRGMRDDLVKSFGVDLQVPEWWDEMGPEVERDPASDGSPQRHAERGMDDMGVEPGPEVGEPPGNEEGRHDPPADEDAP